MSGFVERILQRYPRLKTLSRREKILLVVALAALVGFVFHLLFLQPLDREKRRLRSEVDRIDAAIQAQQQELDVLTAAKGGDPTAIAWAKLKKLRERQATLDQELEQSLAGVVCEGRPEEILRRLLAPHPGLQVMRVAKEEARPFLADKDPVSRGGARIFRQTLEVEFEGGYLDFLGYLSRLEDPFLLLFWDVFELETLDPPHNRLRLKLHYLFYEPGASSHG